MLKIDANETGSINVNLPVKKNTQKEFKKERSNYLHSQTK